MLMIPCRSLMVFAYASIRLVTAFSPQNYHLNLSSLLPKAATAATTSKIVNTNISRSMSVSVSVSVSPSTGSSDSKQQTVFNILCLHGKGNNGQSFKEVLQPFEESLLQHSSSSPSSSSSQLSFNFEYITAPFPMDESDNKNMDMQWWTLPPGVRSFNAKEYQGFEESANKVNDELTKKEYDFILGHSQGAILLSALMTSDSWMSNNKGAKLGYILNGCAWPNPFTDEMTNFKYQSSSVEVEGSERSQQQQQQQPKLLFVIGEKDKINPPEGAIRVRDALSKGGMTDIDTCYHPGGHAVPVRNVDALNEMTKWVLDTIH
jgi:predicted esterase